MKYLLFISLLFFCSAACTQTQILDRQEICWVTPSGQDSSLNRYVYISIRTPDNPQIVNYTNASGQLVDVSAGGQFFMGYCHCCTRDTLAIPRIENFSVSQPVLNPFDPSACGSSLTANVYGVTDTSQIVITLDSSPVTFTYYAPTKSVVATQNPGTGTGVHTFRLTVTIPAGTTFQESTFDCQ